MLFLSLLFVACPEAPTDPAMPGQPPAEGQPAPPPVEGGDPSAAGGVAQMPTLTVDPGTGVKLSGEFTYAGTAQGSYRVDFFQVGNDGRPMILHALKLEKPGPWEMEVPKGLGKVNLLAFVDAEGNGPQMAEPSALLRDVEVGQEPLATLNFAVADGADNPFATDSPSVPAPTAPTGAAATGAPLPPADGAAVPAPGDAPPGGPVTPGGAAPTAPATP